MEEAGHTAKSEKQALKLKSRDSSLCSGASLVALGKVLNVSESMRKILQCPPHMVVVRIELGNVNNALITMPGINGNHSINVKHDCCHFLLHIIIYGFPNWYPCTKVAVGSVNYFQYFKI